MLTQLDKSTIVILYLFCNILVLIVTIEIWRQNRTHFKGLELWVISHVMQLVGLFLISTQSHVPFILSSFVASMIILVGFYYFILSFEYFLGATSIRKLNISLLILTSIVFLYHTIVIDDFRVRVISFSLMMVIFSLQAIVIFLKQIMYEKNNYYALPLVAFVLYFFTYSSRMISAISDYQGVSFLISAPHDNVFLMVSLFAGITMTMGLVYVINGRLIEELTSQAYIREELLEETKSLAEIDGLTGLFNRITCDKILQSEKKNAVKYKKGLAILLIDLDHFKFINDTYGHLEGDRILIEFAELLNNQIRQSDYSARWGGDEFLVILPEVSLESAFIIADKLKASVEEKLIIDKKSITISIGLSILEPNYTIKDFISSVDSALYNAKTNGRNTISIYEKS